MTVIFCSKVKSFLEKTIKNIKFRIRENMWWTPTKSINSFWYFSQVFFAAAQKFWVASISVLVLSMSASRGDRAAPFLAKISWSFSLVLRSIWLCFLSMIAWALSNPDSICSNNLLRCSISSSYLKRLKSFCFSLDKFLNSSSRGKNLLLITLEYLIREHFGFISWHRKIKACTLLFDINCINESEYLVKLISKGLYWDFNSSKKRTKNFCSSRLEEKLKFSSSFFGRVEDYKKKFRL